MTDASYSHKFMSALADSLGWDTEAVQKALAEIAQLQNQAQELELSVQGKAPTNHASQQDVFGLADEQMYGHVKIVHEVTNDSTAGIAVSPDAVYAYAPDRDTTPRGIAPDIRVSHEPSDWPAHLSAFATGNFVGVSGNLVAPAVSTRKIILQGVPPYSRLGVSGVRSDGYWRVNGRGDTITLTSDELGTKTPTFLVLIPFIPNNA